MANTNAILNLTNDAIDDANRLITAAVEYSITMDKLKAELHKDKEGTALYNQIAAVFGFGWTETDVEDVVERLEYLADLI